MTCFLGIDVGGTGTRALITNERGSILGTGTSGAGNPENVGYAGLSAVLRDSVHTALDQAGIPLSGISALGAGIAGYDWPSERNATLEALGTLGCSCPIVLVNDGALGLAAVADEGVNLNAGTSNNCFGRWKGRTGSLAGGGLMVGEAGGGMEIAFYALRAINHERIRRGPKTSITEVILGLTGLPDADALIEGVTQGRRTVDPGWAPTVFSCALEGDAVASRIIEQAAEELGESAAAIIRQIGLDKEPPDTSFPLVLSGSLFDLKPPLLKGIEPIVCRTAPGAEFLRLSVPPVMGAVALAMEALGLDPNPIRRG